MPFSAKCTSECLHEEWECPADAKLFSKVPKPVGDKLLELSGKARHSKIVPKFCKACIDHVQELYPDIMRIKASGHSGDHAYAALTGTDKTVLENIQTTSVQTCNFIVDVEDICFTHLNYVQLTRLAYELGRHERISLQQEGKLLSQSNDLNSLLKLSINDYIKCTNSVVAGFLLGVSNCDISVLCDHTDTSEGECDTTKQVNISNEQIYTICKTVESVLNLSAARLLLPLHFRDSVLLYSITGSQQYEQKARERVYTADWRDW